MHRSGSVAAAFVAVVLFIVACASRVSAGASDGTTTYANGVTVSGPVTPKVSIPLRSLRVSTELTSPRKKAEDRENPLEDEPDRGRRGTWNRATTPVDPLAASSLNPTHRTPSPTAQWDGTSNPTGCGGCTPPDVAGDVGWDHYVQIVNATKVAIYDKVGALLSGPSDLGDFWSSGNCTGNAGDPVLFYDTLADRWVLSQFTFPLRDICVAVAQTSDPLGSYFIYTFTVPAGSGAPDYFKMGLWPDGYYITANQISYSAMVVDRNRMLQGLSSTLQRFTTTTDASHAAVPNLLLPAHVMGQVAPPAGAPGFFATFLDDAFHSVGSDRVRVYALDADFTTPANSTFLSVAEVPLASFTYTVCGFFNFDCAPQGGTAQKVDALTEWPMWRLNYRNFGDHESLVANFTVPNAAVAAPRWFELQRPTSGTWTLFQEGTYAPDSNWRYMGSIASDNQGNLALGFTESSASVKPRIRYATRLVSDTAGTLGAEAALVDGGGSQTGSNRWGDYTTMSVDPSNDCEFYYTNEYYSSDSATSWRTRIGTFRIPQCTNVFLDNFEIGALSRWDSSLP